MQPFSEFTQKLIDHITDPIFLMGTVFFGFIVSFLATYAARWTDKLFLNFIIRRKRAVENKKKRFDQAIEKLMTNPMNHFDLKLDILFYSLNSLLWAGVGLICLIIPSFIQDIIPIDTYISLKYAAATITITALVYALRYFIRQQEAIGLLAAFNKRRETGKQFSDR